MRVTQEKECRVCNGELERVLDLGEIYPSSFLHNDEKVSEDSKAPLILDRCKSCGLVQLEHTVDLDLMYRQYWYSSSLNKSMISSLQDIVDYVESTIDLKPGDVVVDIGCNDGTLLSLYKKPVRRIGFDPAYNLSIPQCDLFINTYFEAYYLNKLNLKAKVITAIAMFYDLPDPNTFVKHMKENLDEKGIIVIQFTDLLSMFRANAFDNICHEHLEYYRLEDVYNILRKQGLIIIDVSYNGVNGGSLRVTACHEGAYPVSNSVTTSFLLEKHYFDLLGFKEFRENIDLACTELNVFLQLARANGDKVFVLGASTKGNTLLQVCGITKNDIRYAAEVNHDKFGLRTVGSNIYIIPENEALALKPEYLLVLPWHFKDSILDKPSIKEYIQNGGRLVFPLPIFHIVGK